MTMPQEGGDATWKGIAIIAGTVAVGLLVFASFGKPATVLSSQGADQAKGTTTTTIRPGATLPTTSTSIPLKDPKDVKVLVANATNTQGATTKVINALKPACYTVQVGVDALPGVKADNRTTTYVYSTSGYEREAALITNKLGLQTASNAALPEKEKLPIPTKGMPTFNVLIVVAKDLIDNPPQPLPGADCGTTASTSIKSGTGTTTKHASSTSTTSGSGSKITTTTKAVTTTTRPSTTVTTTH